jgi:hypothetical protein
MLRRNIFSCSLPSVSNFRLTTVRRKLTSHLSQKISVVKEHQISHYVTSIIVIIIIIITIIIIIIGRKVWFC